MSDSTGPVICLMGPTASGKTDLALHLHSLGGVDLISVDSAMVYRGMDIGTAKPEPAVLARAPHALIDIREPSDAYSAAEFAADARAHIAASHAASRVPVLVGGTMLYFRALLHGLSALPAADEAIRQRLEQEAAQSGWPALHARLAALDPATAARLHPNDAQRIQRALEVVEITGAPMSELHNADAAEPSLGRVVKIGVQPESREALHARIEQRFEAMLAAGFIEEVAALRARGDLHRDLPSMRAVGYRQVWDCLEGLIPRDELAFRGIVATRQFARRQLTWLRREQGVHWLDAGDGAVQNTLTDLLADVLG